jgi:pimeloyl-ACP methyl ester carboxylesterase
LEDTAQYESYRKAITAFAPNHKALVVTDGKTTSGTDSLEQYAEVIVNSAKEMGWRSGGSGENNGAEIVLVGHSRGGGAALIAASIMLRESAKKDTPSLQDSIRLVLLDPVDTAEHDAVEWLRGKRQRQNQLRFNDIVKGVPFPPVLIINTPYGGESSYYKVSYESACAPPGRNAYTFSQTIKEVSPNTDLLMLNLPHVGHMQFLDDRSISRTAGVCAVRATPFLRKGTASKSIDALLRQLAIELIITWGMDSGRSDDVCRIIQKSAYVPLEIDMPEAGFPVS